jgi:hypothetical protein
MVFTIWIKGFSAYEITASSHHEAMKIFARIMGEYWQFMQILSGDVHQYQSDDGTIANVKKGKNYHEGN